MKTKSFYESQDEQWHKHYLSSEKLLSEMEDALRAVESVALEYISDETARAEIIKIIDNVWRGKRS